ncbi:Ig-like domain-containing protein [Cellulomonas marina]|uniref:Prepilin-type N-terminal cleavage/methylation domain-containing protein n=1 Tax=Cellulomonas marina TaxID=988821 RepID=A0A1I0W7L9_9CELL|nr:Ig-like domain-containing protein [Cellulomonas marina]GIG29132.1 hypothetical protein Cma02nite_17320 [Cellulomonas marina]SFA84554.1 prepilin-type N-terminal cleavage/methylation domain-containing protein [Cellulomonas marina]
MRDDPAPAPVPGAPRSTRDEGFSLVEVVVALALLAVVATAALQLFVNGTRTARHQAQGLTAVTVANDGMEAALAVAPLEVSGVSGLVRGRTQAAVTAAVTAAQSLGVEGLGAGYPVWDPAATASSVPAVPVSRTTVVEGLTYTVRTLVAACYRPTAVASAACGAVAGQTADPVTQPAGTTRLLRVTVVVSWDPVGGTCTASAPCRYQTSSLVDGHADLPWNDITRPIAVDDQAAADLGTSVVLDVLGNDLIGPVSNNPVTSLMMAAGSGTVALQADGKVKYTAPTNAAGVMTFTYVLRDQAGRLSNTGTGRVSVRPRAVADSASTVQATAVTIPVTANDVATPASVQVVSGPTGGTATVQGTSVVLTPPGTTGTVTFQYTVTDTAGLVSAPATVTVAVTAYPEPLVQDLTIDAPAGSPAADLALVTRTGNPAGYLFEVLSMTVPTGQLTVGGAPATSGAIGTAVGFTPSTTAVGTSTFTYRVRTPDGVRVSQTRTVTLRVLPAPAPDTFTVPVGSTSLLGVGTNDVPNAYDTVVTLAGASAPSCGTFATTQPNPSAGRIAFTAPATATTCTFTYTTKGAGTTGALVSPPVTVTVQVGS